MRVAPLFLKQALADMAASSGFAPKTFPPAHWSVANDELMASLRTGANGLPVAEAKERLRRHGANTIDARSRTTTLGLLLNQFRNPLVLILIFASVISLMAAEWIDAGVVLAIVFGSTILGFVQEYIAGNAIEKLRSQITLNTRVLRAGQPTTLPASEVVPGDIVLLNAGSLIQIGRAHV